MSNKARTNRRTDSVGYVCKPSDRTNKICPQYVIHGCICYTNGRCVNGEVNKCVDCQQSNVYSVLEGRGCPRM